ncbi:hypothetical protein U5640_36290 [Streptomyces sp. SS7]|uniref:hypothetical protein n=1 Tax=Streptomyces sp. SS7 TaxID=3108485 RepID=UPI0030EEFC70
MAPCCARTDDHTHDIRIRSTLDPRTRTPACLLDWGLAVQTLLTPDVVVTTARDLMNAATHAETDIAFLDWCRTTLKVDAQTAGHMLLDIRTARPTPTGKTALRIEAVAGIRTGNPLVHVGRGSMKAELTPDEARTMAVDWTKVAVAAQIDARLRYALGEWDRLTAADIEHLFTILQSVDR